MQILNAIYPLQQETIQEIRDKAERVFLKKGDVFIGSNKICNRLFFLESGSIKSFHSHDDKDYTSWVYFEGEILTAWHSYWLQIPSIECFKANEPSQLFALQKEEVEALKSKHMDFVCFLNRYYEFSMGFYDYFNKRSPNLSPLENYRLILQNYPKLIQRASNSDIASIIGVRRETISRIRAQV